MVKILSIGNSFSQGCVYFLHDIAKCASIDTKIVNLYIPGCTLEQHFDNLKTGSKSYEYELNGNSVNKFVSLNHVLLEENWDFVIMLQASYNSGIYDTYFPYIKNLSDYIKLNCKSAVRLICQTWAYEIDSDHPSYNLYNFDQNLMYRRLKDAYEKAAKEINTGLILCGDVIQTLRTKKAFDYANGGASLCKDGYHLELTYGRYAAACTFYETIFKKSILDNSFSPENSDIEKINLIKKTVHEICKID